VSGVMLSSGSTMVMVQAGGSLYYGSVGPLSLRSLYVTSAAVQTNAAAVGAIRSFTSSLVIDSVVFTSLSSYMIRCVQGSVLTVSNCTFSGTRRTTDPTSVGLVQADSSVFTMIGSTFQNVNGYDLPALMLTTLSTPAIVSNTVFSNITAVSTNQGAAMLVQNASATVTSCTFQNNVGSGMGMGILFTSGPGFWATLTVVGSTFQSNINTGGWGGAIMGDTFYQMIIQDSYFWDNSALMDGGAIFAQSGSILSITGCDFARSYSGSSGAVNVLMVTSSTFSNNVVRDTISGSYSAVYFEGPLDPTTVPRSSVLCATNVLLNNQVLHIQSIVGSTSLSFARNVDSELRGGWYGWNSALYPNTNLGVIEMLGGSTLISPAVNGTMPFVLGVTTGDHNITLAKDWTLNGPGQFVAFKSNIQAITQFNLAGHTLRLDTAGSARRTSFQQINFLNGSVDLLSGGHVVCCNTGNGTMVQNVFTNTALNVRNTSFLEFLSSLKPVIFTGASSALNGLDDSLITMRGSTQTTITANINLTTTSWLLVADVNLTGNLVTDSTASLQTYGSWYNGVNHPIYVTGNVNLAGVLRSADSLSFLPFTPIVTLHDARANVVHVNGALIFSNQTVDVGGISYEVTFDAHNIYARPVRVIPAAIVSNDLSSLSIDLHIDLNYTVPSDCSGFIDPLNNPGLDLSTLRCVQKTSTNIVLTSASLPPWTSILGIVPTSTLFATSAMSFDPPANHVTPTSLIRPISSSYSCGQVTLDGTLSTGIGSYPATFTWTLVSTSDSVHASSLTSALSGVTASTVELPLSLFTVGQTYVFSLSVTNVAGMKSSPATLTFVPTSQLYLPPLILDGSSVVPLYSGSDLNLVAQVDVTGCAWNATLATFQWTVQVGATGAEVNVSPYLSTLPSLWVPSSFFDPTVASYTFRAYVFPDAALGLGRNVNASVHATVIPTYKPFIAISGSKSTFVDEDVVLTVDAYSPSGSPIICEWSVLSCPRTITDYFFGTASAQGDVTTTADCINSTGDAFVFPFSNRTGLTTTVPRGSLEPGSYIVQAVAYTDPSSTTQIVIAFTLYGAGAIPPAPLVSVDLPPINEIFASEKFALHAVVTDPSTGLTLTGLDAETAYTFFWRVRFGSLQIPAERNGKATLVIPYQGLTAYQNVFVEAIVTSKTNPALGAGGATVQLPVSRVPTGGSVNVFPTSGLAMQALFNISAPSWTTPYWPLRYQFSFIDPDTGVETALTDVTSVSQVSGIMFESFPSLASGLAMTVDVTIQVRVFDALGAVAVSQTKVIVQAPGLVVKKDRGSEIEDALLDEASTKRASTATIASLLSDLQVAVNASNWRAANAIVSAVVSSVRSGYYTPTGSDVAFILNVISQLPATISATETNAASLLSQISYLISTLQPQTKAQSQQLLVLLYSILYGENSKFGTSSVFAEQASISLTRALSTILATGTANTFTAGQVDPIALARLHSMQILDGMMAGEPEFTTEGGGVNVSSGLVATRGGIASANVGTANSRVSVTFDPTTLAGSSTSGYIGVNFIAYDGTFTHLVAADNDGFGTVLDLQFVQPSALAMRRVSSRSSEGLKKRDVMTTGTVVGGTYSAKFNASTTATLLMQHPAACAVYDESTGTWSSSGCSTNTAADGTVTCTCNQRGPLTLLFNQNPQKTKQNKAAQIAVAVVVPLVLAAVTVGALLIAWKKGLLIRTKNAPTQDEEMPETKYTAAQTVHPSPAPSSKAGWHAGAKPSFLA